LLLQARGRRAHEPSASCVRLAAGRFCLHGLAVRGLQPRSREECDTRDRNCWDSEIEPLLEHRRRRRRRVHASNLRVRGEIMGIDHSKHWLRFPYVSIFWRSHDLPPHSHPCRRPTGPERRSGVSGGRGGGGGSTQHNERTICTPSSVLVVLPQQHCASSAAAMPEPHGCASQPQPPPPPAQLPESDASPLQLPTRP
jgi:hypothetical protein